MTEPAGCTPSQTVGPVLSIGLTWPDGADVVAAGTPGAGVIRGRTVTTVAKCALDAEQGGAKYVDRPTVVDGNLVTARTWHDNATFLREFMKLLHAAAKTKGGVAE